MRHFAPFLLIALTAYAALAAYMYLFQERLVFFPAHALAATPQDLGLVYEDIQMRTSDGELLDGWFVPGKEGGGAVLFCHGNGGNISYNLDPIQLWHGLGLSVLTFDYRGYGESTGRPTEQGTYVDAAAAWEVLTARKGFRPEEIVVAGRSLGGAVAARLAADRTPRALVVEAGFTTLTDIGREHYPLLPVRLLARLRFPTIEDLARVRCPVLVSHSREDEIVPFEHGLRLFAAAPEPKRFLDISGSHNSGFEDNRQAYAKGLAEFLADLPRPR